MSGMRSVRVGPYEALDPIGKLSVGSEAKMRRLGKVVRKQEMSATTIQVNFRTVKTLVKTHTHKTMAPALHTGAVRKQETLVTTTQVNRWTAKKLLKTHMHNTTAPAWDMGVALWVLLAWRKPVKLLKTSRRY